jgi:hypothetical protein
VQIRRATIVPALVLASATFGFVGCSDTTGSKEEVKVTTPGGTTRETKEIKVNKSGENPPAAPSEKMP